MVLPKLLTAQADPSLEREQYAPGEGSLLRPGSQEATERETFVPAGVLSCRQQPSALADLSQRRVSWETPAGRSRVEKAGDAGVVAVRREAHPRSHAGRAPSRPRRHPLSEPVPHNPAPACRQLTRRVRRGHAHVLWARGLGDRVTPRFLRGRWSRFSPRLVTRARRSKSCQRL